MKFVDVYNRLDANTVFSVARETPEGIYPVIKNYDRNNYTKEQLPFVKVQKYLFKEVQEIRVGTVDCDPTMIIKLY